MADWYNTAERVWVAQNSPLVFSDVVKAHLRLGVVWSGPRSFALARLVRTEWCVASLLDPVMVAGLGEADAWWLYMLAGDWQDAVSHLPAYRNWIGWERHGRMRWHRTDVIVGRALRYDLRES